MRLAKIDFIRLWTVSAVVLISISFILPWWTFEYRIETLNDGAWSDHTETHSLGLTGGEATYLLGSSFPTFLPRFDTEDEGPGSDTNVGALLMVTGILVGLALALTMVTAASILGFRRIPSRSGFYSGVVAVILLLVAFTLFSTTFTTALDRDTHAHADGLGQRIDDGWPIDDSPTKSLQGGDRLDVGIYEPGWHMHDPPPFEDAEWEMDWYLDYGALSALAGAFLLIIALVQWGMYYVFPKGKP